MTVKSPEVTEVELLATLDAAADRYHERHLQLMEVVSVRPARDIDWDAYDELTALQHADWAIIGGAEKQLRAMGRVPA